MQSVSYVIPIPADYFNAANAYRIIQGNNIMEATSGGQSCYNFNWGQWTWHGTILRVYFSSSKPHSTGSITSPATGTTIGEDPTVTASVSGNVSQVDFLAYYDGYDWDGDGITQQYHHMYHRTKTETTLPIKRHVGTRTAAPWSLTWDTELVPEQAAGSVKLIARIRDANGVWYMSNPVTGLTLRRSNSFVRIYRTVNIPERFWVRSGRTTNTVNFTIPSSDNLGNATSAYLLINTWNGDDVSERALSLMKINNYVLPDFGLTTGSRATPSRSPRPTWSTERTHSPSMPLRLSMALR